MTNGSTDTHENRPIGLIAGAGRLPVEFVRHAPAMGISKIIAVGFHDCTSADISASVSHFEEIGVGQLGRLIKIFKRHGVNTAIMLGGLAPRLTIANVRLDFRMLALAAKVKDRRADSVLGAIADEMAKDGIHLDDTTNYLPHLLACDGPMTRKKPDKKQWDDIRFGARIALASGELDIGQTAIVRKHAVVAIEAMEGTDACIKRAGTIAGGAVVVKMAKPNQDLRFDVPCVGPDTIKTMIEAEAAVLALEAGKTFLLDKEHTVDLADRHGIVIIGVDAAEPQPTKH